MTGKPRILTAFSLERISPRLWLIADRGILAVTSMVVVVSLARLLDVHVFGAFSTILAVWFVVEVLLRAAVLNPLVVFSGHSLQPSYLFGSWLFLSLVVTLVSTMVIVVPLYFLLRPEDYAHAVAENALLIVLPYAAFHSLRRALIQKRKQHVSLAMSVCLLLSNSAGMAAIWAGLLPATITAASLVVGGGNLLAAGLGWFLGAFPVELSRRYLRHLVARLMRRRSVVFSTLLLEAPGTGLFSILLGTFGGAAETAHYMAARTLLRPVGIILAAMDDSDRTQASHAVRAGRTAELERWYRRARLIPVAISLLPVALVFVFADELATLVYGHKFEGLGPVVRLTSIVFLLGAWMLPKIIYLITSGNEDALTRAALYSFCGTLLILGLCVIAGHSTATAFVATEIVGALLLTGLLSLVIAKAPLIPRRVPAKEAALVGGAKADGGGQD